MFFLPLPVVMSIDKKSRTLEDCEQAYTEPVFYL